MCVLVAAPVALLAQSYSSIFAADIDADTLHGAFNIPIHGPPSDDVNYGISKYDLVVVDEASMISKPTFEVMATMFNRVNIRPAVLFAGDKCQQPLHTLHGRTTATTSIINDTTTFTSHNSIHHTLYQQFRITDPEYGAFLDFIRFTQPSQEQVDRVQEGIVPCPPGPRLTYIPGAQ